MQFDKGYLSPHFVTNTENMEVVLDNPTSSSTRRRSSASRTCSRCSARSPSRARALLIIAEDIDGEALATLVVNKLRGVLKVAAVKAPGFGDRRKAMLEDIAVLTGGTSRSWRTSASTSRSSSSPTSAGQEGQIDKDNTTIIEGAGTKRHQGRIEQIRARSRTTSDYDREKLQERLAKLAGGVAQINVGAATEAEMKEKKARVEDALHACRAAVEEGILPGGGVAVLRARKALDKLARRPPATSASASTSSAARSSPRSSRSPRTAASTARSSPEGRGVQRPTSATTP
jgi:chaperonin GroEL